MAAAVSQPSLGTQVAEQVLIGHNDSSDCQEAEVAALLQAARFSTAGARFSSAGEQPAKLLYEYGAPRNHSSHGSPVLMTCETDVGRAALGDFFMQQLHQHGVKIVNVCEGIKFSGWGMKYPLISRQLETMNPDTLVILSDYDDVMLLFAQSSGFVEELEQRVQDALSRKPGAVLVSTEAQCCVGALTFEKPGAYFDAVGMRTKRSCRSGVGSCLWKEGGQNAWISALTRLAAKSNYVGNYTFPNAGLLAGFAEDVLRLIRNMYVAEEEDDQAILTDLVLRNPELFVFDYNQTVFANMRWPRGMPHGCVMQAHPDGFTHTETGSKPFFAHASGKFHECLLSIAFNGYARNFQSFLQLHMPRVQDRRSSTGLNYGLANATMKNTQTAITPTATSDKQKSQATFFPQTTATTSPHVKADPISAPMGAKPAGPASLHPSSSPPSSHFPPFPLATSWADADRPAGQPAPRRPFQTTDSHQYRSPFGHAHAYRQQQQYIHRRVPYSRNSHEHRHNYGNDHIDNFRNYRPYHPHHKQHARAYQPYRPYHNKYVDAPRSYQPYHNQNPNYAYRHHSHPDGHYQRGPHRIYR
eukprot:TRINITY_DN57152_c0_g1_i1.p1 TRINITY_DN57152_c0_g1~~TRINITY_DN57152_c0_g1_i1.p1  ORF type:complete len:609 (-),score=69.30 TRINITY_DN57152_c0_g1_i1:299-2050(-)